MIEAGDIELRLVDPINALSRLFRYENGEWDPPKAEYRNSRVDPPPGSKEKFAVLYLGVSVQTTAVECKILSIDQTDAYWYSKDRAKEYWSVKYRTTKPTIFIPLDGQNRKKFGLHGENIAFNGYLPFQELSLAMFERFGQVVHGLCWESYHRNQPGTIYALWHHQKTVAGLEVLSKKPFPKLPEDLDWQKFLSQHPNIQGIDR